MAREWPNREDLYQEGTGTHLDMIEDLQKIVDTLHMRVQQLEDRNAYFEHYLWGCSPDD